MSASVLSLSLSLQGVPRGVNGQDGDEGLTTGARGVLGLELLKLGH